MADILVVGGAGYIGSLVCKRLADAGHRPVVLDNLSTGHRAAVRYGPLIRGEMADPDGELGEDHRPETHLIPLVLRAASGRRTGVEIFGDDFPTPDGTCIRDYIHTADLAEAHCLALEKLLAAAARHAKNWGGGRAWLILPPSSRPPGSGTGTIRAVMRSRPTRQAPLQMPHEAGAASRRAAALQAAPNAGSRILDERHPDDPNRFFPRPPWRHPGGSSRRCPAGRPAEAHRPGSCRHRSQRTADV